MRFLTFIFSLFLSASLIAQPIVTELTPNSGPNDSLTLVEITGSGFTGATAVNFGNVPTSFIPIDDNTILADTPTPQPLGSVFVTVTTPSGTSPPTCGAKFTYTGSWFAMVSETNAAGTAGQVAQILIPNGTFSEAPTSAFVNNLAITPNNALAYFTTGTPNLVQIPTTNIAVSTNFIVGIDSIAVAISPDGTTVYTTDNTNKIFPFNIATGTAGTPISLPVIPEGIAITPSGTMAYVSTIANTVIPVNLVTGALGTPIPVGSNSYAIAITPNGAFVYVVNINSNTVSAISTATNTVIATIPVGNAPLGIAITPNGTLALVVNSGDNTVTPINIATNTAGTPIPLGSATQAASIAITPNSQLAYVTAQVPASTTLEVIPIDLTTMTAFTPIVLTGTSNFDLGNIAISPDPAPAADFTFTPGLVGTPTIFDASASTTAVGIIVSYAWNFGDGTTAVTSSPIIAHTYLSSGAHIVTLTVTNSAGTSTTVTFTGQTVSNNGGPMAICSQLVAIAPAPPANFGGQLKKNKFILQTEYVAKLSWVSNDPGVVAFQIFRNGVLIATVPGTKHCFVDHGRRKGDVAFYTIVAISNLGTPSAPITIVVR